MKDASSYLPKMPPVEARHKELVGPEHTAVVTPVKWRRFGGEVQVTTACAYCKNCSWSTPQLFSMDAAESAARAHIKLLRSHEIETGVAQ